MDDIDLSIYDFYEKYKGSAKLPPTIRIVLRNAIWLQENRESKEFPEGYCVEAEKYRTRIIDGCEKLMLLTEDENDCKDFVKYFATTRHNRESVLSEKDRESKGKFLGTLGQDIKNAQTCEDRAKYLKLNTYFEWRLEEYSDLVQYYTDAVNTLKDIRNSLT